MYLQRVDKNLEVENKINDFYCIIFCILPGDRSIQVTAWAGLSVYVYHISIIKYILSIILLYQTGIR
jgi:hypothetical protein